nr:aldolase/citrate lyase family protein [Pollutimonas harenae]
MYGLFCCSYSVQAAEAISQSGYDFLIFDGEHCPNTMPGLHAQLLALAPTTTASIVRVSELNQGLFKQYLDLGVHALMVPNVQSAQEAELAVQFMKYPPLGRRGVAGSVRGSAYGRRKLSLEQANAQVALIVQAESVEAIQNIQEITDVDGVDAVFFGPNDLAADMGYFGMPAQAEVRETIAAAIQQVRAAGKVAGVLAGEKDCAFYLDAGATVVALASEIGILVAGADALIERVRTQYETEQR